MAEYIVNADCEYSDELHQVIERIVRCKDCEHFENNEASGLYYCWLFDTDTQVNPDGFCAWGKMVE